MEYRESMELIERYKTTARRLSEVDGSGLAMAYATCTGYFSSIAASMLRDLPTKKQEFYRSLIEAAIRDTEHRTLIRSLRDSEKL